MLKAFRKHGIIAYSKKLVMGHWIKFRDTLISGGKDGVTITPNVARINEIRNMRRPNTRKEVHMYLESVSSLLKWFSYLNVSTPNIADNPRQEILLE